MDLVDQRAVFRESHIGGTTWNRPGDAGLSPQMAVRVIDPIGQEGIELPLEKISIDLVLGGSFETHQGQAPVVGLIGLTQGTPGWLPGTR